MGEIATSLKAEPLSMVTNVAQENEQRTPHSSSQVQEFDSAGRGTLKTQKKDFYAKDPDDEASLRNRFEVMGSCLDMLRMRFMANPILATANAQLMRDYADWLCGKSVWGFVVKGQGGAHMACPHVGQVLSYDLAIRTLAHPFSPTNFQAGFSARGVEIIYLTPCCCFARRPPEPDTLPLFYRIARISKAFVFQLREV